MADGEDREGSQRSVSSSGEVGGRVAKFSEGERMGKGQGEQIPDGPSASQDLIAGWMGSAIAVLVSNPLEVLKVRMQTARDSDVRNVREGSRAPGDVHSGKHPTPRAERSSNRPGLVQLWKQEGPRFLYAGAAAPIIGLAFLDSFFFGAYGRSMSYLQQDRQDPSSLSRVFFAGAAAGAVSALLQTPIEVIKTRAQAEQKIDGKKKGSFRIAKEIVLTQGPRGFYVGGLSTGIRDSLSSGIFFWAYFVSRRVLRGEMPFEQGTEIPERATSPGELGRIMLAGGAAGCLAAAVPYPLDIIKTRLQTSQVFSAVDHQPHRPTGYSEIIRQIHRDGAASYRDRYPSTFTYRVVSAIYRSPADIPADKHPTSASDSTFSRQEAVKRWTLRILGMKCFLTGLGPELGSSIIGSAVGIAAFELALVLLEKQGKRLAEQ